MPAPEDDLALLEQAARAAGRIALEFWRQDPKSWEKPDDAGPVEQALQPLLACREPGDALVHHELQGVVERADLLLQPPLLRLVGGLDEHTRTAGDGESA